MDDSPTISHLSLRALFRAVALGTGAFLAGLYVWGLWGLAHSRHGMENKFSALAKGKYLSFLIGQNLHVLSAYVVLWAAAVLLIAPVVGWWTNRSGFRSGRAMAGRAFAASAALHVFFLLRLVQTRPYFLNPDEFGQWYYRILTFPTGIWKTALQTGIFVVIPVLFGAAVAWWYLRRLNRWYSGVKWAAGVMALGAVALLIPHKSAKAAPAGNGGGPYNVLILASDSLRGDRLGCAGYRPARRDGPAADGVSPVIDELASRAMRLDNCFTPIASTIESTATFMSSQYPHTHGLRQMYPDKETVKRANAEVLPLAEVLARKGYDTAAIGDWCAGFYDVTPLGFRDVSVSSFDNFKVYMSQAVLMAHFVVPLYFDNPLGYRMFPQIESFAQFVTPDVVNERVEKKLERQAATGRPFFYHVFYSCNHLPYRSREPYCRMFADPGYQGANANGVDFDIDRFIGGTDLENKWKALPQSEMDQIRALYDGCTRQFDACVGRMLDALKRDGLAERTIVIIMADHGDDMYEPGVTLGHGLTLNGGGQANHPAMIVYVPGAKPRVITQIVRTIDLAPTLAELCGAERPKIWEGKSFATWFADGKPESRPFYAETGFPFIQFKVPGVTRPKLPPMDELTYIDDGFGYQFVVKPEYRERLVAAKQRALRTDRWKLVCTPEEGGGRHFGLFHLPDDPHCQRDLAATRKDVLEPMRHALVAWMDDRRETMIPNIFPGGEPD